MYPSLNQLSPCYLLYQRSAASSLQGCCHLWCLLWWRTSLHKSLPLSLLCLNLHIHYWLFFFIVYKHGQGSLIIKKKILPSSLTSLLATVLSHSHQNQGPTFRVVYTHCLHFSISYVVLNPPPLPKTYHKKCFIHWLINPKDSSFRSFTASDTSWRFFLTSLTKLPLQTSSLTSFNIALNTNSE